MKHLFSLLCVTTVILSVSARRSVVTFHEYDACARGTELPACVTNASSWKCYGRRLVFESGGCDLGGRGASEWAVDLFSGATVAMVEEDVLVQSSEWTLGQSTPISLESTTWQDREWIRLMEVIPSCNT
jgi:hypothetical protein